MLYLRGGEVYDGAAAFGGALDVGSAGVRKSQNAGALIECFARGVVESPGKHFEL